MNVLKRLFNTLKKMLVFLCLTLLIQPVFAEESSGSDAILADIRDTTHTILAEINKLPVYIEDITQMAKSWISTDDPNKVIDENQALFGQSNNDYNAATDSQRSLSNKLIREYLVNTTQNKTLPFDADELSYTTLLGAPLSGETDKNKIATASEAYIKHVTGLGLTIKRPDPVWVESDSKRKYQDTYEVISAISTYNAYLLSDLNKQEELDASRKKLIDNASDSEKFFASVASAPLGIVLRQTLFFTSQVFVDLERLIKLQRQQLNEQAMTNVLLVTYANVSAMDVLAQKAATPPSSLTH